LTQAFRGGRLHFDVLLTTNLSGRSAARLARNVRDVEVDGSNPSAPTRIRLRRNIDTKALTKGNEMDENNPVEKNKETVDSTQKQDRTWATFCHLSSLVAFIGIPIGNILGPLVIWLIKKNEMPLVDQEGKAALNFQISMTIYTAVAFILCFIAIGFLLILPLILFNVILVIIASIKISNGEKFKYPYTILFIK
jgi:uncharacterized Tic20 family protein